MGRGRQKAKHTKVARELKYFSPDTNYSALERELGTHAEPDFAALAAKYDTDDEADSDLDADDFDSDDFEAGDDSHLAGWIPGDEQKRA
ncbi:hypothetical protein B7R54_16240 [Subtercola boreus]|uniref:DUF3073 domain-containing protein n=1 Tax=Subtercola boreus TaxID=120213 RepID=A0A3E0VLJ2_9MICO|nr:DUF3073 domain-containing protein [Subtercola boreus]RFA10581.1 hypothetical protein B7R54_16240 [Subtercola boreus]TQL55873.1 DUF3073 family protein [Subtercola boreus]